MSTKFLYGGDFGLRIEADENEELTESQAMIVAVRDLAAAMSSLAQAHWDFREEFVGKHFFDPDSGQCIAEVTTLTERPKTRRTKTKKKRSGKRVR
jgi:hypothetical protein